VRFEGWGFGLGSGVIVKPARFEPRDSAGEFQWSGLGGTHWWVNPRFNLAGVLMTQRHFGSNNAYAFEFKRQVYRAAGLQ
jgi:CubicO group peptidase (beta-lactamase class C family)